MGRGLTTWRRCARVPKVTMMLQEDESHAPLGSSKKLHARVHLETNTSQPDTLKLHFTRRPLPFSDETRSLKLTILIITS